MAMEKNRHDIVKVLLLESAIVHQHTEEMKKQKYHQTMNETLLKALKKSLLDYNE